MSQSDIQLINNLSALQKNIAACVEKAGRNSDDIRLIAVSKTRPLEEIQSVASFGHIDFGENTVQDALNKIPYINENIEWHFIGHLQSKKAGKIPGYFQWIHSVDSMKLAQKLSTAMCNHSAQATLNCLIQVNVSGEATKSGLLVAEVKPFLKEIIEKKLPGLKWRGLMTMGVKNDEQQTRQNFSQLKTLQQACKKEFNLSEFDQLSMGMSGDYCLAIEEGATMIRVGTSIFGQRETDKGLLSR